MKPLWLAGAVALFSLGIAGSALADKASDTLNLAFPKDPGTTDAYFSAARESVLFRMAVWDGLVYRDEATGDYKGNLATEWRWVDDKTLEFKLRQGVKFHNGDDFTADDVVYTVNYMIDPAHHTVAPNNVDWMTGATKVDPYTVRITTKGPFPAALEYLAGPVVIYPHDYYAKVGPSGMGLKPVGTGPYQVVTVEPGKHYVLKRFEGYHAGAKPKAAIATVDIRTIPDINTQVAELFSGGLDLVWGVPDDQAEKIKSMDQFAVVNGATMRIGYINMDAASRGGSGDNPFAKLEVRQAVAHAIDRKSIVTNLVKGSSEVLNAACYPTQFGCTQDVTAYAYDPAAAKALLAKAGYPNGFTTDFYAYRDQPLAEAMMADLAKIGITAKLKVLQYPALRDMQAKGGAGFAFMTWGSNSINDVSAITGLFFRGSDQDFAHDDQVKTWLEAGDTTVDPAARKENYTKALKRIADQAYWLPLFSYNTNYVFSKEVDFTPTPDEIIRFYSLKWK